MRVADLLLVLRVSFIVYYFYLFTLLSIQICFLKIRLGLEICRYHFFAGRGRELLQNATVACVIIDQV